MATTFDAGQDELVYNFEPYQPGVRGTIPEPSTEQIQTFLEVLRQVMPTVEGPDGKKMLDLAALNERFKDNPDEAEAIVNSAVSAVCSGTPTADQIGALPYRVKQRFYGWVVGTFLAPEA